MEQSTITIKEPEWWRITAAAERVIAKHEMLIQDDTGDYYAIEDVDPLLAEVELLRAENAKMIAELEILKNRFNESTKQEITDQWKIDEGKENIIIDAVGVVESVNQPMIDHANKFFAGINSKLSTLPSAWFGFVNPDGKCFSEKYLVPVDQIINGFEAVYGVHALKDSTFCGIGFYRDDGSLIDEVYFDQKEMIKGRCYDYKFCGYANLVLYRLIENESD